jgi:hypothetical protein
VAGPDRREVERVVADALARSGFHGRNGIYEKPLSDGVAGWLSLSLSLDRDQRLLDAMPKVGVRHDGAHHFISTITGQSWQAPSVSVMLGYLMPQGSANVVWQFHERAPDAWPAQADDLRSHIIRYGEPWMTRLSSPSVCLDSLAQHSSYAEYLRPALLAELDRPTEALRALDIALEELRDRDDDAAREYRTFAAAAQERLS